MHDALQAVQGVGFEGEHPLVVGETEGGQGRTLDVGVLREAVAAMFGHDAGALFGGLEIPVVGAHEGVDHRPVAGGDAAEASGNVALVELGGGVQSHTGPHGIQELAERAGAQAMVGVLQDLGIVVEPPHHQVCLGAEAGHVVEAADFRTRSLHVVQGFGDDAGALAVVGGQGLTEREHGVEGVVLLVVDLVEVDVRRVARIGDAGVRVGRRLGARVAGLVARGVLTDAVGHSRGMSRVLRVLLGRHDGVGMRGRHGVLLGWGWLTGGSGGRAGSVRGVCGARVSTGSGRGVAWARRGEAAVARADGVEGAGAGHSDARGPLASRLGRALFEYVDQR